MIKCTFNSMLAAIAAFAFATSAGAADHSTVSVDPSVRELQLAETEIRAARIEADKKPPRELKKAGPAATKAVRKEPRKN